MIRWRIKTRRGRLELSEMCSLWARFAPYVGQHRWQLAAALVATVGATLTELAAPWPIKLVFDYVLSRQMSGASWMAGLLDRVSSSPTTALAWICGAILLIAMLDAAFAYARDVLLAVTGQRVLGKIRQDLFAHLQSLPPTVFEQRHAGDLLTRLTGDVQMLRQLLIGATVTGCQSILMVVATLLMMLWLNPALALLGVATAPVLAFASWRIARQIRRASEDQREKESVVAGIAHDVLGAMSVVQAFSREPIEQKRFSRQNRSSVRAGVKTTRLESRLYRLVALASAGGMCAILFVGVRAVLDGRMTAGDLLVFMAYLRSLNRPLRNLSKLTGQVAKATSCGRRVAELFRIEPDIRNLPEARALDVAHGAIAFEDVSFRYATGAEALAGVSFAIPAGQRVAIIGHTGAGKSTLFRLLLRFGDPQRGAVRVDGHDLRSMTLASLRGSIGWVHQDTVLFGMSIAENIALGRPDASIEEIREVARRVHVDEFVDRLPRGYDTLLGVDGGTLSGGQRQRLALARALLRSNPILLLDEPATGLDELTRRAVERAWMSTENRATTLVICHQLRDMERFDQIILMGAGRVVARGAHAELAATSEDYRAMLCADELVRIHREAVSC